MRKKLLSIVIGIIMTIGLVGCSETSDSVKETVKNETKEELQDSSVDDLLEIIEPLETTQDKVEKQTETTAPVETTKPIGGVKGTNQLTEEMNEEVEVFKCLTDLEKEVMTRTIEVGGKVGISAWQDSTLYSQDTGIASVEGMIVSGVSEGTTYVVVESQLGLRQVYKIIVK